MEEYQYPTLGAFLRNHVEEVPPPEDDSGCICLGTGYVTPLWLKTPCEHVSHRECLTGWLKTVPDPDLADISQIKTCPSCRRKLCQSNSPQLQYKAIWAARSTIRPIVDGVTTPMGLAQGGYTDAVQRITNLVSRIIVQSSGSSSPSCSGSVGLL